MAAMAQPLNFGNDQMAHSGLLPWKTTKTSLLPQSAFQILVTGHSLIKFLLKNLQKRHFLSRSGIPGLDSYGSYGPTLNFGNDQMAHSGLLPWTTCKNHTFAAIRFSDVRFWWLAILCLNFFWKKFKRHFLSRSGIPGLDGYGSYGPTPQFWERSDGTFWAIAMKNMQKPHFCRNPLFRCSILVIGLWLFFRKTCKIGTLLSRSEFLGLDSYGGYGPTPQFWERSDGAFWAIAMKNMQKLHFCRVRFWWPAILWLFFLKNFQKRHFLSRFLVLTAHFSRGWPFFD